MRQRVSVSIGGVYDDAEWSIRRSRFGVLERREVK